MKVHELIALLQTMPQDLDVLLDDTVEPKIELIEEESGDGGIGGVSPVVKRWVNFSG